MPLTARPKPRCDLGGQPGGAVAMIDLSADGVLGGGTRGWSIFNKDGTLVRDSGLSFEYALIAAGHYPDKRSDAKGVEPEGMEFAVINGTPMVFVLSRRGSVVDVYDVTDPTYPVLTQLLPSGVAPEGAVAIPARGFLATANEADLAFDADGNAWIVTDNDGTDDSSGKTMFLNLGRFWPVWSICHLPVI